MYFLEDCAVQSLGNSVVLQGVMNSKFLLHAFPLEMEGELLPSILASVVRVKGTNVSIVLGFDGGFVLLVCVEGVTLVFEEVEIGEPSFVICKTDIVSAPHDHSDWCRPP